MAINYANLAATAKRLIQENGTAATLSRIVSTNYDPISDTDTPVPLAWTTYVVLTPVDVGKMNPDLLAVVATLVDTIISFGLIADLPAGISPLLSDTLTVSGTGTGSGDWIVKGVVAVQPAGDGMLYTCLLSRAAAR